MSNLRSHHQCDQDACKVRENGACLEGLKPEDCPHHSWLEEDPATERVGEPGESEGLREDSVEEPAVRDLHGGEALRLSEVGPISGSGPSRLVVLVGDQRAGKTTLITCLYEKFLTGPFCGQTFAGSLTLLGFEERAFDARMDSGRERPDTAHTRVSEGFRVLHICLADGRQEARRIHMLFGDLSGEWYRLARENSDDARELRFLRHADHLCLLVDGRKLVDPRERLGEIGSAQGTLRSLLEAGMLGTHLKIDVVCSKWDLVRGDEAGVRFVEQKFDEMKSIFGARVQDFNTGRIAARPDEVTEEVPLGFGLEALMARWTAPEPERAPVEYPLPKPSRKEREYTRFARRYPQGGSE